jgi:hypothetical protein
VYSNKKQITHIYIKRYGKNTKKKQTSNDDKNSKPRSDNIFLTNTGNRTRQAHIHAAPAEHCALVDSEKRVAKLLVETMTVTEICIPGQISQKTRICYELESCVP